MERPVNNASNPLQAESKFLWGLGPISFGLILVAPFWAAIAFIAWKLL